ncbi:hypothetical protein FA95DRAFT_1507760 [Auriscalpium vulgare]|uniref:Uncharacterized protein n=1 Tax=Auriscalpium vulgare TaxID=40419 RepID=A0ACB8SEE5_9AGAM|nr:hypothetical protein FA95DRAFT_1507760 [Auriscalpium vulgare]
MNISIFPTNTAHLKRLLLSPNRKLSTSQKHTALDSWIAQPKRLILHDTFHSEHLADLYITLPTRDGTRRPYEPPRIGTPLGHGHHLAFFHPRTPEAQLRPDGTDADFCPPPPFVRRMWAGGRIDWRRPLHIGGRATSTMSVAEVQKKGFEDDRPMVFVKQRVEVRNEGEEAAEAAVVEERTHVYLALQTQQRKFREDFSFTYTPSATTLFRFSALTFNGHHIHLDRDYAQQSEGYPERLVHGPLTALMLVETLLFHHPDARPKSLEYRALNPVIVNRAVTINGSWTGEKNAVHLWTQDEDGVIGMRGTVTL